MAIKWLLKLPIRVLLTPTGLLAAIVGWVMYEDTEFSLLKEIWGF